MDIKRGAKLKLLLVGTCYDKNKYGTDGQDQCMDEVRIGQTGDINFSGRGKNTRASIVVAVNVCSLFNLLEKSP